MGSNYDISGEEVVIESLSKLRCLRQKMSNNPKEVIEDFFQMPIESGFAYYPIDIIELRHFITQDSISLSYPNILFSHKFVKKHCSDYPIVLCIDINGVKKEHGIIIDYGAISLKDRLKRIYVSTDIDGKTSDSISSIIKDTETKVDVVIDFREPKEAFSINVIKTSQSENAFGLNPTEQNIFDFLIKAKNNSPALRNAEMRVCGGWTRDKIMGKESDDIDIAVSYNPDSQEAKSGKYISGFDFAKAIGEYANSNGIKNVSEPYSVSLEKSATPKEKDEVIEELKVGGIKINGVKIEFIGLRTETYDSKSREPKITPTNNIKDDVLRRDLTINSLYYNIETKGVEDYAGGMNDIQNKILRTPTDAEKTFTEDPLRMLRVLRFSSKLPDFTIDDGIIDVMKQSNDPSSPFSQSYTSKIAASRASKEIRKMMEGKSPIVASRLMLETGFYKLVFGIPQEWKGINMDQQSPFHNLTLLEHTLGTMESLNGMLSQSNTPDEEKGLVLLAAFMHDFGKMHPEISQFKIDKATGKPSTFERDGKQVERLMYVGHEGASADFAKNILKNMNFNEEERKFITLLIESHMTPHDIAKAINEYESSDGIESSKKEKKLTTLKKSVGRFLQKIDSKLDEVAQSIDNIKRDKRISETDKQERVRSMEKWIPIFNNAWEKILSHGIADDLAKGKLTQNEIAEIKNLQIKILTFVQNYRNTMGELTRKPVSDGSISPGDKIRQVMKEVIPSLKDNAMISGIHYIRYVMDKIIEQQHIGTIQNVKQMEDFIRKNAKGWANLMNDNNKKAFNWSLIKKADASSGEDPSGFDGYEDKSPIQRAQEDIKHVNRDGVPTPFQAGDEVVLRFGGLGRGRMRGVVRSVEPNGNYIIEWQTGKYKGKIEHVPNDQASIKLDKA